MDEENKFYLRVLNFSFVKCMDILRTFIDFRVLPPLDFDAFLDQHKHIMFHKYYAETPCCECNRSVSIAAPNKKRTLNTMQMELLYKMDGPEVQGHVRKRGRDITQYCLCKVSANTGITTGEIDIGITYILIQTCAPTIFQKVQPHLDTLRSIRNELAHSSNGTLKQQEFTSKWDQLQKAILAIAREISPSYERREEKYISQLKEKDVGSEEKTNLLDIVRRIESQEEDIKRLAEENLTRQNEIAVIIQQLKFLVNITHIVSGHRSRLGTIEECRVRWWIDIPREWVIGMIKHRLRNMSEAMNTWFKIKSIRKGSLVLHTSVKRSIINNWDLLLVTIESFLQKIVIVCGIDTTKPHTVAVYISRLEDTNLDHKESRKTEIYKKAEKLEYQESESEISAEESIESIYSDEETTSVIYKRSDIGREQQEDKDNKTKSSSLTHRVRLILCKGQDVQLNAHSPIFTEMELPTRVDNIDKAKFNSRLANTFKSSIANF